MNRLKETKTDIELNGQKIPVKIYISWDYDQDDIAGSFDFGDEKENKEYLRRFETGELMSVWVKVEAAALGESGTDCLGACHVKNDADILETVSEYSMIDNAAAELSKNITEKFNLLKGVFL